MFNPRCGPITQDFSPSATSAPFLFSAGLWEPSSHCSYSPLLRPIQRKKVALVAQIAPARKQSVKTRSPGQAIVIRKRLLVVNLKRFLCKKNRIRRCSSLLHLSKSAGLGCRITSVDSLRDLDRCCWSQEDASSSLLTPHDMRAKLFLVPVSAGPGNNSSNPSACSPMAPAPPVHSSSCPSISPSSLLSSAPTSPNLLSLALSSERRERGGEASPSYSGCSSEPSAQEEDVTLTSSLSSDSASLSTEAPPPLLGLTDDSAIAPSCDFLSPMSNDGGLEVAGALLQAQIPLVPRSDCKGATSAINDCAAEMDALSCDPSSTAMELGSAPLAEAAAGPSDSAPLPPTPSAAPPQENGLHETRGSMFTDFSGHSDISGVGRANNARGVAGGDPHCEAAGMESSTSGHAAMKEQKEGVPLFVMLPLDTVTREGELRNPRAIAVALQALKSAGIAGVMIDVWWGVVERDGPRQYNWTAYLQVLELTKKAGLKLQAVMSFHACGNNVGDTAHIPLPRWVRQAAYADPTILYTDATGALNPECISLFADNVPCLAGRTPLQVYEEFMAAFKAAMGADFGTVVIEVAIGMGPCGELRYPAYPEGDGRWRFPGVGEFQCYDSRALEDLQRAAQLRGQPRWGLAGPHDAGNYNSRPYHTAFFRDDGSWKSEYGQFFLEWYSGALVEHGERMLRAALRAFHDSPPLPPPCSRSCWCQSEGGRSQAEHTQSHSPLHHPTTRSHSGLLRSSSPSTSGSNGYLNSQQQVSPFSSPFNPAQAHQQVPHPLHASSSAPSFPALLNGAAAGNSPTRFPPSSIFSPLNPQQQQGSHSTLSWSGGSSSSLSRHQPGSDSSNCCMPPPAHSPRTLAHGASAAAAAAQGYAAEAPASSASGAAAGPSSCCDGVFSRPPGSVRISLKCAGIHWWYRSVSHAAELTAGYYNPRGRNGYSRILKLCRKYSADFNFTCCEMRNVEQPPEAQCGPQELLNQARVCAAKYGVPFAGENALARLDQQAYDQMLLNALSTRVTLNEVVDLQSGAAVPVDHEVPPMAALTFLRLSPHLFEDRNFGRFISFVRRLKNQQKGDRVLGGGGATMPWQPQQQQQQHHQAHQPYHQQQHHFHHPMHDQQQQQTLEVSEGSSGGVFHDPWHQQQQQHR